MEQTINATEMQEGDKIAYYGNIFILGEVKSAYVGTDKEVYWSIGICENPTKDILTNYYFYDTMTKTCKWQFQGNSKRQLAKII